MLLQSPRSGWKRRRRGRAGCRAWGLAGRGCGAAREAAARHNLAVQREQVQLAAIEHRIREHARRHLARGFGFRVRVKRARPCAAAALLARAPGRALQPPHVPMDGIEGGRGPGACRRERDKPGQQAGIAQRRQARRCGAVRTGGPQCGVCCGGRAPGGRSGPAGRRRGRRGTPPRCTRLAAAGPSATRARPARRARRARARARARAPARRPARPPRRACAAWGPARAAP